MKKVKKVNLIKYLKKKDINRKINKVNLLKHREKKKSIKVKSIYYLY